MLIQASERLTNIIHADSLDEGRFGHSCDLLGDLSMNQLLKLVSLI